MKKLITLINLLLLISMQWGMAQVNNLRMSDLREINFQAVKLIGNYETYSAFSVSEDYSGFKNLFVTADVLVYCDVLYDIKSDDKVALNEYLNIVKSNYGEVETAVKITRINLPSFAGKKGTVVVDISKTVSGLNKCKINYTDLLNLVVTINFQFNGGLFENFKISEISCKNPRGKLIVLKALDEKGKALPNESFLINKSAFTTDNLGIINYHYMNKDSSLLITTPVNSAYNETIKYNNYQELLAHSKKGTSPCEPGLVEFTVKKAEALATTTKNKETKKEKLERENYEKAIAGAVILLNDKKYVEAKASYQSALKIRPDDKVSQEKIKEIDASLGEIKARNEKYAKAVAEGDAFYKAAKYPEALETYQQASTIKPEEKYPFGQIEKINGLIAGLTKKEENYAYQIAEADKLLSDKKYIEAKASYQSALKLKPGEKYPQQKLSEIDIAVTGIKARNDNYNKAIAEGDTYYNAAKYLEASEPYKRANTIKPEEKYPLEQIEKINGILAELKIKDENYTLQIAKADKLLAEKKYNDAIASYNKALVIKPAEKYPRDKISAIKSILAGTTSIDEQYTRAVSDGNDAFVAEDYEIALANYKIAKQLKPELLFLNDKIAQTEKEIKRLNDSYAAAIADGDNEFKGKQYQPALEAYNRATNIKPGEEYPLGKINEIKEILAQLKVTQQQYDQAVAEGNVLFGAKNYEKALLKYKAALQFKPEEQLPKDKIAQAETEIKKLNESYTAFINEGDKMYTSKKYQDAIVAYQKSKEIKPSEQYPDKQISLIRSIIDKEKSSEFSVGIVLNYILPFGNGPVVLNSGTIQNKVSTEFSLGYGVIATYNFKLDRLGGFRVRTGLTMDNINFRSELLKDSSQNNTILDPDNYQYTRKIQVNNLAEEIKLSYITIPLGLEKIFSLGNSGWALSLSAGVNIMFLTSAKYESSAAVSYEGYYPQLFNLTIRENEVYDFGNFTASTSNNIKAKSSLISMDFGAGLSKKIGKWSIFTEFRYRTSTTDMFEAKNLWSLSENYLQLESTMNFKNSYHLRYNFLTFGLAFNL